MVQDAAPYLTLFINHMSAEIKPMVEFEVFERLDIRVGRVLSVEAAPTARKRSYLVTVDFGKYGVRRSVARLTMHSAEELTGKQVLGVLNLEPREIGGITSEFLTLGVQVPGADSGEATIVIPLTDVKVGSKLF
jgi:tRNA-binding protein